MKYHVGDRWADGKGNLWLIFRVMGTLYPTVYAELLSGCGWSRWLPDGYREGFDKVEDARLVRLVSSERWLRFDEQAPEDPQKNETRCLLIRSDVPEINPTLALEMVTGESGRRLWAFDAESRTLGYILKQNQDDVPYTHWKYVSPPDESGV